jgi:proteasome lid subunit RPN8/RPN11
MAPLRCRRSIWRRLLRELRLRGAGRRESGAFLLGTQDGNVRRIKAFLPFDEVDPDSLIGHIDFDGSRMDRVWEECRRLDLSVVADIHTHPEGFGQSAIDRANPMMPRRGHIGLIVPDFAADIVGPGQIGIYELLGLDDWADHSAEGPAYFSLEWF